MILPAERMKAMRELRLVVPDARAMAVRRRVAKQVAGLGRSREYGVWPDIFTTKTSPASISPWHSSWDWRTDLRLIPNGYVRRNPV